MVTICGVVAREIFDSRGNPTVEVDLHTERSLFRAAVPSGASTGIYEARELRDGGARCFGKGVLKAVENINGVIGPRLVGMDVSKQGEVDKFMVEVLDSTSNQWGWCKSKVGANAILAISMAVCRAGASAADLELFEYIAKLGGKSLDKFVMPVPAFNVINGGSHAGNRLACQEFMVLPVGADSFREAMRIGMEVYHRLRSVIKSQYGQDACNVGDEGGFAPSLESNTEALQVLMQAIVESGHAEKVRIGTDVAASEFYNEDEKSYDLDYKNPNGSDPSLKKNSRQLIAFYREWVQNFPLVSIEDPFDQDDWEAYRTFTEEVGKDVQIVGDDLLVTNPTRVKKALKTNACNALLLKVNQIGTVTEAIQAATMAQDAGWGVMVSHRSGETEDSFIADLAVGLCAGQIKSGAPCRSERLAKYNQLLRIEEDLGDACVYAGAHFRLPHLAANLPAPMAMPGLALPPSQGKRLVIIGYGPAGHAVAKKLQEKAPNKYRISVLCEEGFAAYNRVKLTSFFEHRSPDTLALSSESWCTGNGVSLIFGKVGSVDRVAKQVQYTLNKCGSSASIAYDELVFATGSKPFVPPAPPGLHVGTRGVFVYRTIQDSMDIIEHAKVTKRAAVIGGGLLGLEAAKAVYDLKVEQVDVIELAPHLMCVQVDAEAGALVKSKVEALGVVVHTGTRTLELILSQDGSVAGLKILENDEENVLDVQMVIVSTGVRPRQELAEECGLELGVRGGIKVDGRLRSATDQHVHAVGEIAALDGGMVYGLSAPGYQQAEVLTDHLADDGATSAYTGSDLSTKLKLLGVDVGSFGDTHDFWFQRLYCCDDGGKVLNLVARDEARGTYKKLVFTPDGMKMLGGVLVGDNSDFARLSRIAKMPDLGGLTPDEIMSGMQPPVDDGGDGTNLADEDQVCNCHCVPKGVIKRAIERGADTHDAIRKQTQAGTGCGTCISSGPVPKILAHTLFKLGKPKGLCPQFPFEKEEMETLVRQRQLKNPEEIADQLSFVSWSSVPADAQQAVQDLIQRCFFGRKKGDGMSHLEQLRAVRADLWSFVDSMNCNPILVRLAWHDSGTYDPRQQGWPCTGGANGSIIYDPEISHGANNGLSKAVKFLETFKEDYPLVSWADLIQMASAISIEHAGGPKIDMVYGRVDVGGPDACPEGTSRGTAGNAGLPDAEAPYGCGAGCASQHLRNIFYRMGFGDREIVALSGAHTLGRAFQERSGTVPEGYGESKACKWTKAVGGCPVRHDGKPGVGMPGGRSWTKQWLKFDNSYFKEYAENDAHLVWFSTDRALHTDDAFKPYFLEYKANQDAFFRDYAEAHKKLSELGSKFEPQGGIAID